MNFNPGIELKFIGHEASITCNQSDEDSSTGLGDLLNIIAKACKARNQGVRQRRLTHSDFEM
ncbi:hypothetical protein JEQ21_01015 [Streptococcus sp. 121]|uniref:hypothetical protein n=1 Tax=Streptococcus sp. 121 TaxID=2797637 RepID=UPI0018F092D9|nr:hypothetical protein [Streptococcus sp. 121]MBJ6745050.1 hypothetical protein [Streptococcus sp. 121]